MSAQPQEQTGPNKKSLRPDFDWQDPLLLDGLLTEEERMIGDTAHQYAQEGGAYALPLGPDDRCNPRRW